MITDTDIREILIAHGFELKEQLGMKKDLHPYVYRAVRAVTEFTMDANMKRIEQRLPADCRPPRPGVAGLLYAITELNRKREDAETAVDLLKAQLHEVRENTGQFIQKACQFDPDSESLAVEMGLLIATPVSGYCSSADNCNCADQNVDMPGYCYQLNPLVFGGAQ